MSSSFTMPPEWHPHSATWLAWPFNHETWPNNLFEAQFEFLNLMEAILNDEPVHLIVPESQLNEFEERAKPRFNASTKDLSVHPIETNDAWIRDYGPTFVIDPKKIAAVDWVYNAWGGKYPPYDCDQKVTDQIIEILARVDTTINITKIESKLCIEGGAIEINENKILMSTLSCALDPNRNKTWNLESVDAELRQHLGAQNVVWLDGGGVTGDDTDGHIDQLARFAPQNRILVAQTNNSNDPQYRPLQENWLKLQQFIELDDSEWQLIALPLPNPIRFKGIQIPASYCNFYITNQSVIVPQFGDIESDRFALEILQDQFPNRNIVGLPSNQLTVGLGSFHCLTQQQPASLT
ncbi:MAG: agmatine deiminase family protein [Planctomycetota bacterium]